MCVISKKMWIFEYQQNSMTKWKLTIYWVSEWESKFRTRSQVLNICLIKFPHEFCLSQFPSCMGRALHQRLNVWKHERHENEILQMEHLINFHLFFCSILPPYNSMYKCGVCVIMHRSLCHSIMCLCVNVQ